MTVFGWSVLKILGGALLLAWAAFIVLQFTFLAQMIAGKWTLRSLRRLMGFPMQKWHEYPEDIKAS